MSTPTVERWRLAAAQAVAESGTKVPVALVLAIIQAESSGVPAARRGEPQAGDASIGLMQVLYGTAKAMGYTGPVGAWNAATGAGTGLYDPSTNLRYGVKYLAGLLEATGGDTERAISAYNAGLGNAKRFDKPTRFCLAWKPSAPKSGRSLDRDCASIYTAQAGEFGNQPYITKVVRLMAEYDRGQSLPAVTITATRDGVTPLQVAIALAVILFLLFLAGVL